MRLAVSTTCRSTTELLPLVLRGGIEPPSLVFQTSAKTTSANEVCVTGAVTRDSVSPVWTFLMRSRQPRCAVLDSNQ